MASNVHTVVSSIFSNIVKVNELLDSEADVSAVGDVLESIASHQKTLQSVTEDVTYIIKASDEELVAILGIFKDCVASSQNLIVQASARLKAADLKGVREAVSLIEDAVRGALESYKALSEADFTGSVNAKNTIPVTVITGFLGAGKTTLLNYILTQEHGKRIAVVENEFGEIGIDDALIKDKFNDSEEIFQMNNGCICCTVRGDLIRTLGDLMTKVDKFDYILIETTGLADPAPIIQTFFSVPEIGSKLRMDAIITLVDAKHVLLHLDEERKPGQANEAVEQIAFADRILLNKTDLVSADELESLRERIQSLNRFAKIIPTQKSVVDLDAILNIRAFDLDRITDIDPSVLDEEESHSHDEEDHHDHHGKKDHDHDAKEKHHKDKKGKAHSHHLDEEVSSVGIAIDGDLDMASLQQWMGNLLRTRGADIYRMKGVLSISEMDSKFVFQGVHMLFDGNPTQPWGDEKRQNKLIFIGKNLSRDELEAGFRSCLV